MSDGNINLALFKFMASFQLRERRRRKAVVRDYDLVPKFLKEQKPSMAKSTVLGRSKEQVGFT